MLVVSGICAFSDIMCILMEGVKHKFPVFFFNALFNEPSNIVVGKKITDTFLKTKFSV